MSQPPVFQNDPSSADVHCIGLADRTILLIGTAHVSLESAALVREVIARERPDCVCLELDDNRYHALMEKEPQSSIQFIDIIKKRHLPSLLINLLMVFYQRKLGRQLDIKPGADFRAAAQTAHELEIPIALCDRDFRITLGRAWKAATLFQKGYLLITLLATLFDTSQINAHDLEELKNKDVLSELMEQMARLLPAVKTVLIDERDIFLAERIKESWGERIVAVVGAGHVEGVKRRLGEDNTWLLDEINSVPPASRLRKMVARGLPALIIGVIIAACTWKGGL